MRPQRILAARGIHYFVTRFGPAWLRSLAFDEKYRCGDWRFMGEADTQLRDVIRQYLRGGHLLILGCGGSSVFEGLEAEGLKSALGIDLSDEAIRLASRYASPKISFQKANMMEFQCPQDYDVILFSESLYYAPVTGRKALLERLANHLKPEGVLVVTLAQAERYRDIIELIRDNFKIISDCKFSGSSRHLLVFRG